ncbi:hypothetical protein [Pectobacterium carotovorum]|uniref:hypothetical protein n=1 Tax=Pectobacterium carotovorum TaxID=554 RepID=UPI00057D07AF|nr:hypothetical protein [Pectobacterium carotovorum]KHT30177.1 hypothetical protein RC98_05095 [Pectobacterium carotovorum subsp. carotovorum]
MTSKPSVQFEDSMIDATEYVMDAYKSLPGETFKRKTEEPTEDLHPQAAEMFVYMSAHMSLKIDICEVEYYEDYSHSINCLALSNCLSACELSGVKPSFESPNKPDPYVKSAYTLQMMDELNREQSSRIKSGMWKVFYDAKNDKMHSVLARRRRASLLNALDAVSKKEYLESLLPKKLESLSMDEIYYAMSTSEEYLSFLIKSDPISWSEFENGAGFTANELAAFHGFLIFLDYAAETVRHSFWYDNEFLTRLCEIYGEAWPEHKKFLVGRIDELVSIFSLTPTESARYLLPVPFYKLHGKYLRNPAFLKYQNISIALLTIAIRINENLWSKTLGSTLAKAADSVANSLPEFPNLKVTTRRNYPGGDIDLALYDTASGHMFVIEVKTVYDKHRVDSLNHRFESAKVNVEKAVSQLRETALAFEKSQINIKGIFGDELPHPKKVHFALLTWFDSIDLTMETDNEDVLSLNFCLLRFLVDKSNGNLELMAKSIHELRNIWLMSKERNLYLGQPELNSSLEVQVNMIDAREELLELNLSPLTVCLLNSFQSISDMETEETFISYLNETKHVLLKT